MRLPWRTTPPPAPARPDPARPNPDGPGGTREMPAVTSAAAPGFERVGDAVVRTDDPRAAAARQQLVHDRARARRERVDPLPIPGRAARPPVPPRGPAMTRMPSRASYLQFDAPVRSVVRDGPPVTWSPPPDPGPPPPIYRQLADERLHDPRTPDVEEIPVSEHRLRDDELMPIPSAREVFDPDRGADGGGRHTAPDTGEVAVFPEYGDTRWGDDQDQAVDETPALVACHTCGSGVSPDRIRG